MAMPSTPCIPCADAVITSGIDKLVMHWPMIERTKDGWHARLNKALELFRDAQVGRVSYTEPVGEEACVHGEYWRA